MAEAAPTSEHKSLFIEMAERWLTLAEHAAREGRLNGGSLFRDRCLVEEAISAAVSDGYLAPFESLLTLLSMPYEDQPAFGRYVDPPRPDQIVHQTFCGT